MAARLRVTLVKSPIGHTARTRGTLRALGLRRVGQAIEIDDTEQMRGMTRTVRFLLSTEPIEDGAEATTDAGAAAAASESSAPAQAKPRRSPRTKKETDQ